MKTKLLLSVMFALMANIFNSQSLDTTFGNNGSIVLNNFGYFNNPTIANDGSILLPGVYYDESESSAILRKINADGTPDTTFGVNGKFEMNLFSGEKYYEEFNTIKILEDGKILLLYFYEEDNWPNAYVYGSQLIRLNPNGTVDNSFNNPIYVKENDSYYGYEVLDNGKIICISDYAMRRFSQDGALDTSFANAGIRTLDFDPHQIFSISGEIYLRDSNGNKFLKFTSEDSVASGTFTNSFGFNNYIFKHNDTFFVSTTGGGGNELITKLNSNLSVVNDFGENGILTTPPENLISIAGVQQNGSLLSGTDHFIAVSGVRLQRINPNGVPDSTFGSAGVYNYEFSGADEQQMFYHSGLKKMYVLLEDDDVQNKARIYRFNIPDEILAVQTANSKNNITILENPMKDILRLSSSVKNGTIYNISGNKTSISFTGSEVSVSKLSPGVYILSATDRDGGSTNLKFIKK
jgi:uncharacterized delta-60 repeat protein